MILAGNQPYFLPYLGYWQLINAADIFLICDNYSFIEQGWIAKNRILLDGVPHPFWLQINHASSNRQICGLEISNSERHCKVMQKQLYFAYHKAPYFNEGSALFCDILYFPNTNLAAFLENSIRVVCDYLGIQTTILNTSGLNINESHKSQDRIFDYCELLEANVCLNSIGGQKLYDPKEFANHGLTLKFLKSDLPPYKQFNDEFVPGLSILDAIMFCSKEQLQEMLGCYSLV